MHFKSRNIIVLVTNVLENNRDHVRAVPLTRFDVTLFAFQANVVDTERSFATVSYVVHEQFHNRKIISPHLKVLEHVELK